MLKIKNVHASIGDKKILNGFDLEVGPGEIHAIMGPNGSGKSTLANLLAGREDIEVTEGSVTYLGKDLLELSSDERACEGIFLAFQYPVEIPGVSNSYLLKESYNALRKHRGEDPVDAMEFLKLIEEAREVLGLPKDLLYRSVNEGFSGGEKKKNEIFQMALLKPRLAILDETDSGLDIDALKVVADGVNRLKGPDNSAIVVTHYQRLLNHIVPDYVHVLVDGQIAVTGGKELAFELEERGYDWVNAEPAVVG